MSYAGPTWERAMHVQEVLLKALSGEIHWFQAADILGMHPRSLRRWRERYEQFGYHGLIDKRYQRPSKRRVPIAAVEQDFEFTVASLKARATWPRERATSPRT